MALFDSSQSIATVVDFEYILVAYRNLLTPDIMVYRQRRTEPHRQRRGRNVFGEH
jgi:hypothetical protein